MEAFHPAWEPPTPTQPDAGGKAGPVLSAAQVEQWRSVGWLVVDGLLPAELLSELQAEAETRFPPADGAGEGEALRFLPAVGPEWPAGAPRTTLQPCPFLRASLHPRVARMATQLLGEGSDPRLIMANLVPKLGSWDADTHPSPAGQPGSGTTHTDASNNHLCVPRRAEPEAVSIILYLSEVAECLGPTTFVPHLDGPPSSERAGETQPLVDDFPRWAAFSPRCCLRSAFHRRDGAGVPPGHPPPRHPCASGRASPHAAHHPQARFLRLVGARAFGV